MCSHFWHGGLGRCCAALPTKAGLSIGARLIPAHYPGPSQLSSTESPGATAPVVREIQMFPVKSDGKSYKTLICTKKWNKVKVYTLCASNGILCSSGSVKKKEIQRLTLYHFEG